MRIVFMGTPDFAVPALKALIDEGHEIAAVYTQPDKPQGRRQVLTAPPVKELAIAHGIPVLQPDSLKDEAVQRELAEIAPELICVVAYGKLLPAAVLQIPKRGCINVHGSLLPRWRGAAPIQWTILAGDKMAGVTTMLMNEGLDTGDMLLQYHAPVRAGETAGELFDRLSEDGAALLVKTIDQLDFIAPTPQNEAEACHAPMLDKQQAVIDWSRSAEELDCHIRGLNPWPIALTAHNGRRLKLYRAEVCAGQGAAGTVLSADAENGLVIACGSGALRILSLQLEGKRQMEAAQFVCGRSLAVGEVLGE